MISDTMFVISCHILDTQHVHKTKLVGLSTVLHVGAGKWNNPVQPPQF